MMAAKLSVGGSSRIIKELSSLQHGSDLSLAVAFRDEDVSQIQALIIGPPGTPYEYGFFEFSIECPQDYPLSPPAVRFLTTDGGHCRFGPNIYACGKVCLSILGTYIAGHGESWSGAQGLESVLISIQSLLNENPCQNEPGFEDIDESDPLALGYSAKVRHESLRISVVERMEKLLNLDAGATSLRALKNSKFALIEAGELLFEASVSNSEPASWDPFASLVKQRFLWYFDAYCDAVETHVEDQRDGDRFVQEDFEERGNEMLGRFQYVLLRRRLERVRTALRIDRSRWVERGRQLVGTDALIAAQLDFTFQQLKHQYRQRTSEQTALELTLPDAKNPFQWTILILGREGTKLENGVLRLTMVIPPEFPDEQPYVSMDKPIFHHRISQRTGTVCYIPAKPDDLSSHFESLVSTLEDDMSTYDPRLMITPAVFRLRWGNAEDRRQYYRQLRRSVEATLEA